MTQRTRIHFLEDVVDAVNAIERFIEGMDIEAFASYEKILRAIEREFEIIGDAVKKFPESLTKSYNRRVIASFKSYD